MTTETTPTEPAPAANTKLDVPEPTLPNPQPPAAPAGPMFWLRHDGALNCTVGGMSMNGELPDGAVACTQAQCAYPLEWSVQNGAIVAAPTS
ncbi:MAG TPA: hypothetical protein VMU59_11390 [Caulobacteraceae bacterium]|nr:hypothetical protein [Caulobacteraceae bacterium]